MDQTELENQNLPGNIQQRGADPGLDRLVRLSADRYPQFQSQIGKFHAADTPIAAAQLVCQKRFVRAIQASITTADCFSADFTVEKSMRQH